MAVLKVKIPASTMIEVIVAVTIIAIVFSFAMLLFAGIQTSGSSRMKIYALSRINHVISESKASYSFLDEEFAFDGLRVKQSIAPYKNSSRLFILHLEAFDIKNRLVAEKNELIRIYEN